MDDAGALLFALGAPSLDVLGVVSSHGGHAEPKVTARNTRRLLSAAGRADVPVIEGAETPVGYGHKLMDGGNPFHGPDGMGGVYGPLTDEEAAVLCTY